MTEGRPYGICEGAHGVTLLGVSVTVQCTGGKPGQGYPCVLCFTQNTREEVRLISERAGCLAAEPGTHQSNYLVEYK